MIDERAAPAAVEGPGPLRVDLGGSVVHISSSSGPWIEHARRRYRGFTCIDEPAALEVIHSPEDSATGVLAHTDDESAVVRMAGAAGTDVLDGVLRTALPGLAAPDAVVHAALLRNGDHGLLCCGKSGAGKSTMAGLFPEAALCDEMARLHLGENGVLVRSLPFWTARRTELPLAAVFLIEHGSENRRTRLGAAEALRRFEDHVYWPPEGGSAMAGVFHTVVEVACAVPVLSLEFLPDRSVWEALTAAM